MMEQQRVYVPHPVTEQGFFTRLRVDQERGEWLCYGTPMISVLRNAQEPLDCVLYRKNQAPVLAVTACREAVAATDDKGHVVVWNRTAKASVESDHNQLHAPGRDVCFYKNGERVAAVGQGRSSGVAMNLTGSALGCGDLCEGQTGVLYSCDVYGERALKAIVSGSSGGISVLEGPPLKLKTVLRNFRNGQEIFTVSFSPDGRYFAGCAERKVIVFDNNTNEAVAELVGHEGILYDFCWSPDSSQILSVSGDKTAKLWDIASQSVITNFTFPDEPGSSQVACVWTRQSNLMITLSLCGSLNYLNPEDPTQPRLVVDGPQGPVNHLAVDPSTGSILGGLADGRVLNIVSGSPGGRYVPRQMEGSLCGVVAGSGRALAAYNTGDILLMDSTTGEALEENRLQESCYRIAGTMSLAVAACKSDLVLLREGKVVGTTPFPDGKEIAVNEEGTLVAASSSKNKNVTLFVVSGDSLEVKGSVELSQEVSALGFSPGAGSMLAVGLRDGKLRFVETEPVEFKLNELSFHSARITTIVWRDETHLITGSVDASCFFWDLGRPYSPKQKNGVHFGQVEAMAALDAGTVVSAGVDGRIIVWSLADA